jgi:prepilin-type N-terminal cleavage/methylation domain-containing protein
MKRAFTLIEIIVVIIILGIVGTITTKILIKVYKQYYYARALNRLSYETDKVINLLAVKLQNRVKNSVIGVECNVSANTCINRNPSDNPDFKAVSDITSDEAYKYPVLEWIGKDIYAKRGVWSDSAKRVLPGYSGFTDLIDTAVIGEDDYNITTPYSNFKVVEMIESNWTKEWGILGDVFDNNYSVLLFSGSDDRGAFLEINNSYGYYETPATQIFSIDKKGSNFGDNNSKTILHIKAITKSGTTTPYEGYYILNSAYAIVPSYNKKDKDFNLTLFFNYHPWKKEKYFNVNNKDANHTIIATHVTQFKFREDGGVLRIYMCIQDPKIKAGKESVSICKEKVVF